jgi:hypothetical protein
MSDDNTSVDLAQEASDYAADHEDFAAEFFPDTPRPEPLPEPAATEEVQQETPAAPVASVPDAEPAQRNDNAAKPVADDQRQHQFKSDLGRINALSRRLHDMQSAGQAGSQQAQALVSQIQSHLDRFNNQFPDSMGDLAGPVQALVHVVSQQQQIMDRQLNDTAEVLRPVVDRDRQAVIASQEAALQAAHPDWRNVVATPEFSRWLQQQPDAVQGLAQSYSAADSIWLINNYRQQSYPTANPAASANAAEAAALRRRREQQKAGAASVAGRQSANVTDQSDYDAAQVFYAKQLGLRQ